MAATVFSSTPPKRALPAGMCRADHAGFGVGEQHGTAIGTQDTDGYARLVGDHRVGLRALAAEGLPERDNVRRMDLMNGRQQVGRDAHRCCDAVAILAHLGLIVLRTPGRR